MIKKNTKLLTFILLFQKIGKSFFTDLYPDISIYDLHPILCNLIVQFSKILFLFFKF